MASLPWPCLTAAGGRRGRGFTEHTPVYLHREQQQQQRVTMTTGSTRAADSACYRYLYLWDCCRELCATLFVCASRLSVLSAAPPAKNKEENNNTTQQQKQNMSHVLVKFSQKI